MELTPPGEIFQRDFRQRSGQQQSQHAAIKLLQWNIERGYQLQGIIEELRSIDADIVSLQEVDVGCERSGGTDTGVAIAQALGLNYAFLSEFEELHSPLRDARSQGGGVHGNAVLSKLDFLELSMVRHRTHPVDWNNPAHPLARREPRRGERAVLRAVVATPQGPLVVYNAHLEVFCGLLARISQLSDIFADARAMADRGFEHQAILGDMNTMAHGIARLSPNYCCDHMRFRSIGMDEAMVWHRHVLPVADPRYAPGSSGSSSNRKDGGSRRDGGSGSGASNTASAASIEAAASAAAAVAVASGGGKAGGEAGSNAAEVAAAAAAGATAVVAVKQGDAFVNPRLLTWGLPFQVAQDATNPGFSDPFDTSTATLDNPSYRWFGLSLMKGKLDWVLLRRLQAAGQQVGNHDYRLSDHKWLAAEVLLDGWSGQVD